ncbi:MAG: alpha/beta hydrolase [Glaciimonas sp.]|nr:alpha/beta hydrolase [Glaciimonas sp.]
MSDAISYLIGKRDVMTPPKAAHTLIIAIPGAKVTLVDIGHALMTEQPDVTLDQLFSFATGVDAAA